MMVRMEDNMDEVERIRILTMQTDRDKPLSQQPQSNLQFKFFKNQEIPEFFYDVEQDKYLK